MRDVDRLRGWPATLSEGPVGLRPLRLGDVRVWRDTRVRNADWLRPWEPSNPETPLFKTGLGPYISMVGTLRREARQGMALPWVVTYGDRFAGQLTIGAMVWGRPAPHRSATGSTARSRAGASPPPPSPWPSTIVSSPRDCTGWRRTSDLRTRPAVGWLRSSGSGKKAFGVVNSTSMEPGATTSVTR